MRKILSILMIGLMINFSACSVKLGPNPAPPSGERVAHPEIESSVPYGFKEACQKCHEGYTDQAVCGKYYNPACAQ